MLLCASFVDLERKISLRVAIGAIFMPSCATVDQVSRVHGLILGSGKPGLNQV